MNAYVSEVFYFVIFALLLLALYFSSCSVECVNLKTKKLRGLVNSVHPTCSTITAYSLIQRQLEHAILMRIIGN